MLGATDDPHQSKDKNKRQRGVLSHPWPHPEMPGNYVPTVIWKICHKILSRGFVACRASVPMYAYSSIGQAQLIPARPPTK
jgi:hypothetical protein